MKEIDATSPPAWRALDAPRGKAKALAEVAA